MIANGRTSVVGGDNMGRPEDERVKIPALLHLTRLGYSYLSLQECEHDEETNIFLSIFRDSLAQINMQPVSEEKATDIIQEIRNALDNDDLGREFFKLLQAGCSGLKLIDFEHPDQNSWHVVTELPCKRDQDEFRPDITLLINGLPLVFIEVKRPNNVDGIQAERDRMDRRLRNPKFRRFINMTQLMIFSNNGEYDDSETPPLSGAFYATIGKKRLFFDHFREEQEGRFAQIADLDPTAERKILLDTHLPAIKHHAEYLTNLSPTTPTHRILSSMASRDRLLFLLRYGLVYVDRVNDNGITETEKHVMRYPQLFATQAIEKRISDGGRKGVIWHTQGSGKTALAYFNVRYLSDYFQHQGVIARFYFIVDRLDLLQQAADEFRARGLTVNEVNSKDAFEKALTPVRESSTSGGLSITVVNIQKFSDEAVAQPSDYGLRVQRVYFMDEAHRSYNPKGSFLSYLQASDRQAIWIALTGTPLIGEGYNTKDVFGPYIHKYYYNASIKDGYTLRLMREGIRTEYRVQMQGVLESIRTLERSIQREDLYAHEKYVQPLVQYIVEDFTQARVRLHDPSIGGMIICDSSKQAREVFRQMKDLPDLKVALILHDEDDIETRKQERIDFKKGAIDILIVFNMLLTGFDAPRLKRLYVGRVIKDHNLLQALTRVNRPYGCLGRRLGIVRCDKAKVNPRWLYYFFLSPEWTHFTQSHKVRGSTVDRLSVDDFPGYEIPLPSLEEQNRAVDAIFPVDQKIDLNTRLCAELECMARTLYDYWFVQFDFPDENGKPYRSSGGEMVWCQELRREVPKGWRAGKYSDLIDSVRTGLNPRQNFTFSEGGIQYLTVKNLTQEGRIDFTGCDTIDESARSIVHRRSDIRIGDVLFASIAPLGRCYLIQSNPDDWDINESVFSLRPNYSCVGVLSFLPDLWLLQDRFWPVP